MRVHNYNNPPQHADQMANTRQHMLENPETCVRRRMSHAP